MAKQQKTYSPKFLEYTQMIVNHPNYNGLPIKTKKNGELSWVAGKTTQIGKERVQWANEKASNLGLKIQPGVYAKLMFKLHPTKMKICQICGSQMSLKYIYLNASFIKQIKKKFNHVASLTDTIYDLTNSLIKKGVSETDIKAFYIYKAGLVDNFHSLSLDEISEKMEYSCRVNGKKILGPGAMSNFPDRYDGFHSYNRCCRHLEDTGRSKENLKSYVKDRRAYENWSDGNIHAANKYMHSIAFEKISADHIGPISLGFIHDPRFLQPMPSNENSAKRDRLQEEDLEKLIELEKTYDISAISWFSNVLWNFIKHDFQNQRKYSLTDYRNILKKNMIFFMEILHQIIKITGENGEKFLEHFYIEPKKEFFKYDYTFSESGNIIDKTLRNFTDSTAKEYDRFLRVSLDSITDFVEKKENRKIKVIIPKNVEVVLKQLQENILLNFDNPLNKNLHLEIVREIQIKILHDLKY